VKQSLARTLRLSDLVFLGIGTIIGSGIFLVPGNVLRQAGGFVSLALLVWLSAGLLSVMGALTYGELGGMNPEAGGVYVYLRDAFGPATAFLYGWTLFFVVSSGTVAALAAAFTIYLAWFVPMTPWLARLVPVAMIATIAVVNVRGTRQGANLQNWSTVVKVGAIVIMSLLLLALGGGYPGTGGLFWPTHFEPSILPSLGTAMVSALWAYEGWQYVTFCAGETVDAERTFPRGIVLGTGITVGVYLLANVAYVVALGPVATAASQSVAPDAVTLLMGPLAGTLIVAAILVSIYGCANGVLLGGPRVYFAMARDGLFVRRLAEVHPRFGTPAFAVLACAAWSTVLALSGTFDQLLTYVISISWVFYGLGGVSIFFYRRRLPDAHRPFRVPGYPWTSILFVLSAAAIVINAIFTQPLESLAGLGVVLLGVPAYYFWRRRAQRETQTATTVA
jgi:APA family basic amino acid/polyamine antiporter